MRKNSPSATDSKRPNRMNTDVTGVLAHRLSWFAVQVRSGREAYAAALMETKGLTVFCPTYRHKTVRSTGAKAIIQKALFPGYLFCRIDLNNRMPVLETTFVASIVSVGKAPIEIPPSEIESLQTLIANAPDPQPDPYLSVGQKVRVTEGPLTGVEGAVTRTRDKYRVVVAITLLQRAVSAEVDRCAVLPLDGPTSMPLTASRAAA